MSCLCSECFHGNHWVKVWIHTGHLHIEGRKMSKSLKNFISIKDYFGYKLTSKPGDDFRIFCLLHKYNATLTYSEARLHDAASFRNKVESYFGFVENIRKSMASNPFQMKRKPTPSSKDIIHKLQLAKQEVHKALADDFDTSTAMTALGNIVGEAMQYATLVNNSVQSSTNAESHPLEPLLSVDNYVRSILATLGLGFVQHQSLHSDEQLQSNASSMKNSIQSIVDFRSNIRNVATSGLKELKTIQKSEDSQNVEKYKSMVDKQCKNLLQITDKAREELGDSLNITIDDIGGSSSSWRLK